MNLTLTLVLLIVLAGFIKGFVGFGLSLILISVLFQAGFHAKEFMAILVPIFVVLDIMLFIENRKYIKMDFKENFTLHPTTLMTLFLGILVGTYILTSTNTSSLKLFFAITVLLLLFFLIEKVNVHQMKYPSEKENGFFGFVTGIIAGLFTINAIPPSIYLIYHQYPKEKYMGSLVTFLILSDILLVAVYLFKNLFTVQLIKYSIVLLLITIVGFLLGVYVRKKLPANHFKSIVIFIIAINSLKIIFDYFFFK